jgi:hypothetical protein
MDLDELMQSSNARARRGRRLARNMFAAAIFTLLLSAFLIVAAPNSMGGGSPGPGPAALIGVVGLAVGILWMVRILRADPEPDAKSWRYRG